MLISLSTVQLGVHSLIEAQEMCPNGLWSGIGQGINAKYRYKNDHCTKPPCSAVTFTGKTNFYTEYQLNSSGTRRSNQTHFRYGFTDIAIVFGPHQNFLITKTNFIET